MSLIQKSAPGWTEHRQVTAVFCDLVGSTAMADGMDAEDLRDTLVAYRNAAIKTLGGSNGHVAGFAGDGVLAVFGFPVARDNDARMAVGAALEFCRCMPELSRQLTGLNGSRLSVRIGIHTGPVVVDDSIADATSQQISLIGSALNVGARLQQIAPSNGVVISEQTYDLVQGHFLVESLGPHSLKGLSQPLQVYRVVEARMVRSIFEARLARGLSHFVGRSAELQKLEAAWAAALQGTARSVLLVGDPGIGKSRLLYEFQSRRERENCVRVIAQCSTQDQNTAFTPIAAELARSFGFEPGDGVRTRRDKIAAGLRRVGIDSPDMADRVAIVFGDPDGARTVETASGQSPQRSRSEVIEALVGYTLSAAAGIPLLLIVEDLHWADPSTLEFLRCFCGSAAAAPVLLLCTTRPDAKLGLAVDDTIGLERIAAADCEALIGAAAPGGGLPRQVVAELVHRSDGVPLFVEELTRSAVEALDSGRPGDDDRGRPIVPMSLQDSIMARLDQVGSAKRVAQAGSLIGRSFATDLLATMWQGDRRELSTDIARLVQAEILFEHRPGDHSGAVLEFKHELVRAVASGSILRSEQRAIHLRIAETLEQEFGEQSARQPERLAYHFEMANRLGRALPLWELAGRRAVRVSANEEAIIHLTRALTLLHGIADPEKRRRKELDLQLGLASPVMAAKGYGAPELDNTIARAMELSKEIGDASLVLPLVYGRWSFDHVTGKIRRSRDLALQYLELADKSEDAELNIVAARIAGTSLTVTGQPRRSVPLLLRAIALFDEQRHASLSYRYGVDLRVTSQCLLAIAYWMLGNEQDAIVTMDDAWQRSREKDHVHTTAYCCANRLALAAISGRERVVEQGIADFTDLLAASPLPLWSAVAPSFTGWLRLRRGAVSDAIGLFRQTLAGMEAIGLLLWQPMPWMWLGEALGQAGDSAAAEAAFIRAEETIAQSGESWPEPELYRLWAAMRRDAGIEGAEALEAKRVAVANAQGALGWLGAG